VPGAGSRAARWASEVIACPNCGSETPEDFAFCPRCAAKLRPWLAISDERKVVTTLFCDLVAFTAMSEAADPEDVDAVLRRYHAAARRVIESHGGTVEKFIGDAVVGVFGVPAVHEDDPERAVRAGLRIIEALEGMTRPDGSPLQARVGVNTGEALVRLDVTPGSGEGFLTGDAVNTAARLQAAAPAGGVAVGAATHHLSARVIVYEELPPVVAKGKIEPVCAWLATKARGRTGLRTAGQTTTPFLGRGAELAALQTALAAATETGSAQFRLVVGEPGIGKSRLVLEFALSLEKRPELVTWRQGRCLPYGEGVTFWALGEILKAHAGIFDSDDVATVEAKLEAVLVEGEDRPWLRRRLRPLLGLEASQASREESFAAWTRFLEFIADAGPTVLVLEDLHWAGEPMLAFVEHLLSQDLGVPLLVVATTRPELLRQHEGALTAAADDDRLRRLTLTTLSKKVAGALITALLDAELAAEVGGRIRDLVGGNPLYAEQYVNLLRDRGLLVRAVDGLHIEATGELPLPETVQAVLAARLDTLPPEHKTLLCDAAVIGETFWRGGVAALSGRDERDVEKVMAALAARELVRPVVALSMQGEPEYLFWHALARDAAYGQLPRKVRARKHEAAALWIERQAGERRDEFAEIVAHHYTTALELAGAAGDEALASSLVAPTIRCLTRAGDCALRLDVAAAERHFARALEFAGTSTIERLRLLPRWADALELRGRFRESVVALEEAIPGLEACGDVRTAAVTMCRLLRVLAVWLGEPSRGLMEAAVGLLANDDPSPEQAEVYSNYAAWLQEPVPRIEAAGRAIDICRQLGLPEPAMAISFRGLGLLDLGDLRGLGEYERALAVARARGLGAGDTLIEYDYGNVVFMTKGARACLNAMYETLELAGRHGNIALGVSLRAGSVETLFQVGEWDRALAEASDVAPRLEETEGFRDLHILRSLQALIFASRAEPAKAEPFVAMLLEIGRGSEREGSRAYAFLAASSVRLRLGETDAALGLLSEWMATSPKLGWCGEYVPGAVRTALAGGDDRLAASLMEAVESCLPERRLPLHEHVLATLGGLLGEARCEHEEAAAAFIAAASGWREFSMPHEEAHALLGQGRCLVALGRAPEAAAPLAAAREIFARLGAKPALAETDAVLKG